MGAVWLVLAAALFLRAIIPLGYMPEDSAEGAFTVRLCGEANLALMRATQPHGRGHEHHHGHAKAGEEHAHQPCAFAGLFTPAVPAPDLPPLIIPATVAVAFAAVPSTIPTIFAPRLLPPATGPPSTV